MFQFNKLVFSLYDSHKTSFICMVILLLSLVCSPTLLAWTFPIEGYIYARGVIRDEQGLPYWVEYNPDTGAMQDQAPDGMPENGLATGDWAQDKVYSLSAMSFRAYQQQYKELISPFSENETALIKLSRKEFETDIRFELTDGKPIDISAYPILENNHWLIVKPPVKVVEENSGQRIYQYYSSDLSQIVLSQMPIDPDEELASNIKSLLISKGRTEDVKNGIIVFQTEKNLGFRTAFSIDEGELKQKDLGYGRGHEGKIIAPISGARVGIHYDGGSGLDGKYITMQFATPCRWPEPLFHLPAAIDYHSFNPSRANLATYFVSWIVSPPCMGSIKLDMLADGVYIPLRDIPGEFLSGWSMPMEPRLSMGWDGENDFMIDFMAINGISVIAGADIDSNEGAATRYRDSEYLPKLGELNKKLGLDPDAGASYDPSQEGQVQQNPAPGIGYDFDKDGIKDKVYIGRIEPHPDTDELYFNTKQDDIPEDEWVQGVYLSSIGNSPSTGALPDITRLPDYNISLKHEGMVETISKEDLKNTDIYLVRVSTGEIMAERTGNTLIDSKISLQGMGVDQKGFNYTLQLRNQKDWITNITGRGVNFRDGYFSDWQTFSGANPKYRKIERDHLRQGEMVKIIAINRATGYIGSKVTELNPQAQSTLFTTSKVVDTIVMSPPNLKIWAERKYKVEQGLSKGKIKQYLIGNEGAALDSDETVVVYSQWLDSDGSPLPDELKDFGYTGRIARVSAKNTLSSVAGEAASFAIKPGTHMQLVRVSDMSIGNEHLYIQVSGEPYSRSPSFAGSKIKPEEMSVADKFESNGKHSGILKYRPDTFVPFKVPVWDEGSTLAYEQAYNQAKKDKPSLKLKKPEPVYQWLYRPDYQYSTYDLELDSIARKYGPTADDVQDLLSSSEELLVSSKDELIDLMYSLVGVSGGSADEPLNPLAGYSYGGNKDEQLIFSFNDTEIRATVGSNNQVTFDNLSSIHYLQPEDFLTLRLYSNNDAANILWQFAQESRIVLYPKQDQQVIHNVRVDLANDWLCEDPDTFTIKLTESVDVTLIIKGKNVIDNEMHPAGTYRYSLSKLGLDDLSEYKAGVYPFTLTVTPISVNGQPSSPPETITGDYIVRNDTVNTLAIAHTLEQGIDLYDGHLTFNEQDIYIPGRTTAMGMRKVATPGFERAEPSDGLALRFNRAYSSNNTRNGSLGPGWSHNMQGSITYTACGQYIVDAGGIAGKFTKADGKFVPEAGLHSTLEQDGKGFDFYAKDGTHYHYQLYSFSPKSHIEEQAGQIWYLAWIEDGDDNRTSLEYEVIAGFDQSKDVRVSKIVDSSETPRELNFTYKLHQAELGGKAQLPHWLLATVTGPNAELVFTYNEQGQLISAINNNAERNYEYETLSDLASDEELVKTAVLLKRSDANDKSIRYEYSIKEIGLTQDGYKVKSAFYEKIHFANETKITTLAYDERIDPTADYKTTVQNPCALDIEYELNTYGSVTKQTTVIGEDSTEWDMDQLLISKITDKRGIVTQYEYDDNGNKTQESIEDSIIPALIRTYTTKQKIKNLLESETDRNGNTTQYEYADDGKLKKITFADTSTNEFTYDDVTGDLLSSKDGRQKITSYTYDQYGYVETLSAPAQGTVTTKYLANGLLSKKTDARGDVTLYQYDDNNHLKKLTYAIGHISYEYDDEGYKKSETAYNDTKTSWSYDNQYNITNIERNYINSEGINTTDEQSFVFDGTACDLSQQSDWNGNITKYEYNAKVMGSGKPFPHAVSRELHKFNVIDPSSGSLTPAETEAYYQYDLVGMLKRIEWPEGGARFEEYEYDDLNRKTKATNSSGDIEYQLYPNGELYQLIDQLGRTTSHSYDTRNRLIKVEQPNIAESSAKRVTEYRYDFNGNQLWTKDANGSETESIYDDANRLSAITFTDGFTQTSATHSYLYKENGSGDLKQETDAEQRVTDYVYREMGWLISMTKIASGANLYSAGHNYVEKYLHDNMGNVKYLTTANNVITMAYDGLNRKIKQSDYLGTIAEYRYDGMGNLVKQIDGRDNSIDIQYDALGHIIQKSKPEGRVERFSYDVFGNQIGMRDPNGQHYTYHYNHLNQLVQEDHPGSLAAVDSIEYRYDLVGNRIWLKNKRGKETRIDYDYLHQPYKVIDPSTIAVSTHYYANGAVKSVSDKKGYTTEYEIDGKNQVTKTSREGIIVAQAEYDRLGNTTLTIDANGNQTQYEYNQLNSVIHQLAAKGTEDETHRYTLYNAAGQQIASYDPLERKTDYTPDARGRVEEQTFAGLTTYFAYDGNNNLISKMLPKNNSWGYDYDDANRLKQVTSPTGITTYGYDLNNNRTQQTDAGNQQGRQTTVLKYTANNLLKQLIYPDTKTSNFEYDQNGNRNKASFANGSFWTATYDVLDQIDVQTFSDGLSRDYDFDANGNLSKVATTRPGFTSLSVDYDYDAFDRNTAYTDSYGQSLTYGYDNNGNRTSLLSAGGSVSYVPDALNRIKQVSSIQGTTSYRYYKDSQLDLVTYPSGIKADYDYYPRGLLQTLQNTQAASTLSRYDYEYDDNGNRTKQTELNGAGSEVTHYGFDTEDRLETVTYPDSRVDYSYDANFNRLTEKEVRLNDNTIIKQQKYNYNSRNQLSSIDDQLDANNNVTYGYDASGNQTSKVKAGVSTQFIVNARDEIEKITIGGSTVGQFLYDHKGMRIAKTGEQGELRYTYDGSSVLLQTNTDSQLVAAYQYGPNRLLSLKQTGKETEFYLFDALGSPVNLTTAAGDITARYQYDAWGHKRAETGTSWNKFGFTGHEEDKETGLIYAKARYYDPDTGRFLSQDAWDGDVQIAPSLHKYLYAFGNPVVYWDPTGNCPDLITMFGECPALEMEMTGLPNTLKGLKQHGEFKRGQMMGNVLWVGEQVDAIGQLAVNLATSPIDTSSQIYGSLKEVASHPYDSLMNFVGSRMEADKLAYEQAVNTGTWLEYGISNRKSGLDVQSLEGGLLSLPLAVKALPSIAKESARTVGSVVNKMVDNAMQPGPGPINRNAGSINPKPIRYSGADGANSGPSAARDANGVLRTSDGRFATDPSVVSSQLNRPSLRSQTKTTIEANAPKNSQGQFIDQNGQVITDTHFGHITGHENRRILSAGDELGLSQSQLNDYVNARPQFFKIEDAKRNLSHADEMPGRDNIDHIIIDMEDYFGL